MRYGFLVEDDYGDYKELMNYNDLKQLLIEELNRDTEENITDENIVKNNLKIYNKLVLDDKYKYEYLKEELKGFGYNILCINDVMIGLNDLKEYVLRKDTDVKALDDAINYMYDKF